MHYATVQLWARRGRFDKVQGVIGAMLTGLGVRLITNAVSRDDHVKFRGC
jgi:hypothetical protein